MQQLQETVMQQLCNSYWKQCNVCMTRHMQKSYVKTTIPPRPHPPVLTRGFFSSNQRNISAMHICIQSIPSVLLASPTTSWNTRGESTGVQYSILGMTGNTSEVAVRQYVHYYTMIIGSAILQYFKL
eukprot:jgi/Botrbrau1/6875/Bobra.152_2s0031.1